MDRNFLSKSDALVKKKSVETLEFFSNAGLGDVISNLHEGLKGNLSNKEADEAIGVFKKVIAKNSKHMETVSLAYMALLVLVITQPDVEAEEKYTRIKEISDFSETVNAGLKAMGERWGI
jgi:hypothetical protein